MVDCAALEMPCTVTGTEGSNPSLSACKCLESQMLGRKPRKHYRIASKNGLKAYFLVLLILRTQREHQTFHADPGGHNECAAGFDGS